MSLTVEKLECLDGPDGCSGKVEYRMPLSGTGKPFARCDKHWEERLNIQARINHDYPNTPCAPDWFDESYAGEHWDEDW